MRERLAAICRQFRAEARQTYFKQRRMALLACRQQEGVLKWLQPGADMYSEEGKEENQSRKIELESTEQYISVHIQSYEEAILALKRITDEINWSQEDHQLLALDSLLLCLLRLNPPTTQRQLDERHDLIYVILKQVKLCLQGARPTLRPHIKLASIFSETMPVLLDRNDARMTRQMVETSYELTTRYYVLPGYRVIRHVLASVGSASGLEEINGAVQGEELCQYHSKLQDLLLRYLLLYRVEEQSYSNKNSHVPGEQVIHDYECFIKQVLRKIVRGIEGVINPFRDESLSNAASFILTIYSQILHKFNHANLENEYCLVDRQTIHLLRKIALTQQDGPSSQKHETSLFLSLSETVEMLLSYLNERGRTMQHDVEYSLDIHQPNYLLGVLMVIELRLK